MVIVQGLGTLLNILILYKVTKFGEKCENGRIAGRIENNPRAREEE